MGRAVNPQRAEESFLADDLFQHAQLPGALVIEGARIHKRVTFCKLAEIEVLPKIQFVGSFIPDVYVG